MFYLSYTLHEHGWATASVGNGDATIDMGVSFMSDALYDLARTARGILHGMSEATFSFQDEPGEHRFVISRDGDGVRVSVYQFADNFSGERRGEPVLTAECSLREFATACINCLRRVRDEHGDADYRRRWERAGFPSREYLELLDLRRALNAARPRRNHSPH